MVTLKRAAFVAHYAALGVSLAAVMLPVACRPELVESSPLVSTPRLLAVRIDPAEAAPGEPVSFTALYADGSGPLADGPLDWALCVDRKPLAELGPLSPRCLVAAGDTLVPLGVGVTAKGAVPKDACRNFGPDRPDPKPGEPSGRPVDADPTGGYYQPLRVRTTFETNDAYTVFGIRIACSLSGATQEQRAAFEASYVRNTNPAIARLARVDDGRDVDVTPLETGGERRGGLSARPGERLTLRASWARCDAQGACDGAESYVAFDSATRVITSRRESVAVAWLATSGAFAEPSTGRSEGEAAASDSTNTWTAPATTGDAVLWVVLRDDRGGVGFQTYRVRVAP